MSTGLWDFFGFSSMALTISTGFVVDDAIVVVEKRKNVLMFLLMLISSSQSESFS